MKIKYSQQGYALLMALLILLTGSLSLVLSHANDTGVSPLVRQQKNAQVLAQARQALLGYALSYAATHPGQPLGYLPCPDRNRDGSADALISNSLPPLLKSCSRKGESVIGCLPWRTLGIEKLLDASGNELWYAITGIFKASLSKETITSDSNGLFVIQNSVSEILAGKTEDNQAIAVVFSVGDIVAGQSRNKFSTLCTDPEQYLETFNNINNASGQKAGVLSSEAGATALPTDEASVFVHSPLVYDSNGDIIFNDNLSWITPDDFKPVYKAMDRWVAEHVRGCFEAYNVAYIANYIAADAAVIAAKAANDAAAEIIAVAAATIAAGRRYPWLDDINHLDYEDDGSSATRFGRAPDVFDETQADNANMPLDWLLVTSPDTNFGKCFDKKNNRWNWWNDEDDGWKKQVFVVVNLENTPPVSNVISSELRVAEFDDDGWTILNTHLAEFVVIVAGRKITPENIAPSIPFPIPTPPFYYHNPPFNGVIPPFDYNDLSEPDEPEELRSNDVEKADIHNYLDTANENAFIPPNLEIFAARSNFEADTVCTHAVCF